MMRRRLQIPAGLAWLLAWGSILAAEPPPSPLDFARAAQMAALPPIEEFAPVWQRPPFAAGGEAAAGAPAGSLEGWQLRGLLGVGDRRYAILGHASTGRRMYVSSRPNKEGFSLEEARADADPEKEAAVVRCGADKAEIHYPPELLEKLRRSHDSLQKVQPR